MYIRYRYMKRIKTNQNDLNRMGYRRNANLTKISW